MSKLLIRLVCSSWAGAGWCDHALSRAQSDKGYKTTTTTAESQTVKIIKNKD